MCLQANPLEGAYDVVFHTEGKHDEVMKKARKVEKARPMCHYEVTSLAKNNFRVITVNMYNPHVKDEEVRVFMGRYMDNVSSARLLKDFLGFWNGRRSFQALLREDPKGLGGYLHPPALFSLGADRGTLFYAHQPPFCRRCMAYGHNFASCGAKKCRVCGSEAHEARDCDESKKCHGTPVEGVYGLSQVVCSCSWWGSRWGSRRGGRGGGVSDPSAGPEAIPAMTEEEPRTAAGGEGDGQRTAVAVPEGEVVPETEGSVGEEVPETEAAEGEEVGEVPATTLGGEEKGGEGGPEWGESEMSSAQGDEVREMMEELVIKGGWVSPLPREEEGEILGWVVGEKGAVGEESPVSSLLPPNAQGGEGSGSPSLFPTCFEIGVLEVDGGEPRMQGTQEPSTIPTSWVGEMEGSGGASGVESESLQEEMELFSDHGGVLLQVGAPVCLFGRGYWKLEREVLDEQAFVMLISLGGLRASGPCVRGVRVVGNSKGYCKRKKREERREVDHIQRLLELELEAGNLGGSVDWERSSALKAQLREVPERKACAFLERAHNVEQGNVFLEHLSRRVLEDIREAMKAQISLKEFESALRRMGKGKVPGMDGLPAEFFLKFWGKLGPVRGLDNGLKDLNWLSLHKCLPLRSIMYRRGMTRSHTCPRPTCGGEETLRHVFWGCAFAGVVWARAQVLIGRVRGNFVVTWARIERGVGKARGTVRDRFLLWLLISLFKRGLWEARQKMERTGRDGGVEGIVRRVEQNLRGRMKREERK
ncbi:unnamed protein product [Coregonus sp. 'balchen']|nr:unnamed protein product [Coregonus sp. 'balchen']